LFGRYELELVRFRRRGRIESIPSTPRRHVERSRTFDKPRRPEDRVERHGEPEWESVEEPEVALVSGDVPGVSLSVLDEPED
jgi:hypothetical protein